jgi:sigma-B regulation protein RsbU (phosphoserine phosphatase)
MARSDLSGSVESLERPVDSQAFVDNLAAQLRMAGQVQRDFLPKQLPDSHSLRWATMFLPAEWVSGDIYDVARLDEDNIGFYVADVVGHGMPAALLTIFIKQAMVMRQTGRNSYRIFSPAEVLQGLNQRITEQKLSGQQFASCCYCLLNTERMQVIYVRAGHPYPVLIRAGKEPQQLKVPGQLLGIFSGATYTHGSIQLQKGDKLLVYSDGVERIIGGFEETSGFAFSDEFRRIKDLPVGEMFERLNLLAQENTSGHDATDDITAIGVEVL